MAFLEEGSTHPHRQAWHPTHSYPVSSRDQALPSPPEEAAINTTTPNPLSLAPWTVLEVGGVVMDAKVPICRLLPGSLRPGPASRLVFRSPRAPRLGTLGLLAPAWSSSRPGGTWPQAEALRVTGHRPPPRRPSRFGPGSAPHSLHCSPAVRSCAWCPEQLGGGPRTSQRGIHETRPFRYCTAGTTGT